MLELPVASGVTDPEILTFDELYKRAAAIVGQSERSA
jgi:hypothetical protein